MTIIPSVPPDGDVRDLIKFLSDTAKANADKDTAVPLAVGTFAMYPMENGGVMFVASVSDGPMAGTHKHQIPPGIIRAATALAGGAGGKMRALKALIGKGGNEH